ncbi:GNAT family N-acetyltransferase [Desulfosporosinus youngiae]|uniref:Acetyltransferase, N-acetylglutamate synthase n=1 Tax=Desulfosporosinus youngiae DSM 17734 TaxID=768710 RepID=H5Y4D6_9FIRM|nr:GNAT family N-acetyltransferase [Desulfosporosinus youngiae]EHQ89964.1 acetyltransferase, N-acetylglutamate synthase [Desulfosporosinus youngiae DSM 17734]
MLIRQATETDLPQVIELLQGMDEEEVLTLDEALKLWQRMKEYPYYKIFVAEDKKVLIGTCSLIMLDNLGHLGTKLAVAESMIVSKRYRGRGVGKELMQFIMGLAKEEKCYKLMLSSNKKRVSAHKFYEQLGFMQHGISFMVEVGSND